ncbi:MAG: DUF4230 domain-containing protein [Verrucomicrobia bacterium]|nr:DUF4230 domain-containing protein [Verrucomicrobiota bacterium]
MNQRIVLVGVVAALLAVLALSFAGGIFVARMGTPDGRPRISDTATVVTQIQTLSHLVTVKYVFEKVVVLDDVKWYGQNRLLMIAHGVVKAGVDLSKVTAADVTITGDRISLKLPRPLVMDTYLDEAKTEVLERSTGILRTYDQQMEQEARRQALEAIRKAARASGILKDAEERTRLQLTTLAHAAGFTSVEISFR